MVLDQNGVIEQREYYYPFGASFPELTWDGNNAYKYNGKELDKMHGLNLYDYSARHYDPAIGRFTSVDPLAEFYYSSSPYIYCANNPLKYVDPTGMAYTYNYDKKHYEDEDGNEVSWNTVNQWLTAQEEDKTDQEERWGTITLYANPGGSNDLKASKGKGRFGHTWIAVTDKEGAQTTFGTFKKGVVGKEFQINFEKNNLYEAYKHAGITTTITKKQRLLIDILNQLPKNNSWGWDNNCTDYGTRIWNSIIGEDVYSNSGLYKTPTELYNIIININAAKANELMNNLKQKYPEVTPGEQYPGVGLMPR